MSNEIEESNIGIEEDIIYSVGIKVGDDTWRTRVNGEELAEIKRRVIGGYYIETASFVVGTGKADAVSWYRV